MRLIVFFDLPVKKAEDRKAYQNFRSFLLNDGYDMIQFSVYSRICNGIDGVEKHFNRLEKSLPPKGSIRALTVTEKQYSSIKFLVGDPKNFEKVNCDVEQMTIFDIF